MQSRADSSAFLSGPERILPFIDYALQGRPSEKGRNSALIGEGPVPTLRIVRDEDGFHEEDGDMMRTAVNLLLSLFEGVKWLICMKQALLILFYYSQSTVQTIHSHDADCANRHTTGRADGPQFSGTSSSGS